jgi:hypothetical protein
MEAGGVNRARRDETQPAHQLRANCDAAQQCLATEAFAFACGEHRRHDYRARMHRTALECVVVVFTVRGGAIDQRRIECAETARMAERRAGAARISGLQRRADVVFAASGDAQTGHVE